MNSSLRIIQLSLMLLAGAIVAGCGDSSDNSATSDGSQQQTGLLSVNITDAPLDGASELHVYITGLELKPQGGKTLEYFFCDDLLVEGGTVCSNPTILDLDLLALQGKISHPLMSQQTIPAQEYNWIRLILDETNPGYLKLEATGDTTYPLTIPSGEQTSLKINTKLSLPEGHDLRMTIDFDLRQSLHQNGAGDYILRPTLRLVDNRDVGHLHGTVDAELMSSPDCSPAVYLSKEPPPRTSEELPFNWAIADDIHPENDLLLTTTYPALNPDNGHFEYDIGFIPEGDYFAAFTCDARSDDPATDDDILFAFPTSMITIEAQKDHVLNIEYVEPSLP